MIDEYHSEEGEIAYERALERGIEMQGEIGWL